MLPNFRELAVFLFTSLMVLAGCASGQQSPVNAPPPGPSRWPMQAQTSDGVLVTIYQPQLEDFQGDTLSSRAAVAVTPAGQQTPIFGAVWLQSRVAIDRVARTVRIVDVNVTQVRFPNTQGAAQPNEANLAAAVKQAILAQPITLSLDHLLASLEVIQKQQAVAANLQTNPPKILFREHPALLVQYDGTPQLLQASDTGLMRVVNTPFFVGLDPSSKTYYLKAGGHWYSAGDPMGPFQYTTQVPAAVSALATQSGYADPPQAIPDAQAASVEIVTATDPTALIWTDGPPLMATIPGTGLLYWSNTESDVFLQIDTQKTFVLLSGRWYCAADRNNGPWAFVAPNQLPADFAKIPADSPKANVLADVAGTQAARDAVADTAIPQTATVDVNHFDQPPVSYDGDPNFAPIEGTDMTYAVNTDASVVDVGGVYYCCYGGVWYTCANPNGPWSLCTQVPAEIYTIPPSCPIYPVRFCYIYGSGPGVIYCGYTPGYTGCYDFDGVVVYGTGYNYKPWFHKRYVPRPYTFGFGASYHAYSGHWGFDFGMALGGGDFCISQTERYVGRGGAWFGYGGYRPSMVRNARINQSFITANNANIQAYKQRDVYARNVYQRRTDLHSEPAVQTPRENAPAVRQAEVGNPDLEKNDVYAGPNGNVYRKTDTGWETRQDNQWKPTNLPEAQPEHPQPAAPNRIGPEHPQAQTPRPQPENPPRPEERPQPAAPAPQRENPPAPEEHHEQPAAPSGSDVNRDYQARQAGNQRIQNQPQATPPPRQEPGPQERGGGTPGAGPSGPGPRR